MDNNKGFIEKHEGKEKLKKLARSRIFSVCGLRIKFYTNSVQNLKFCINYNQNYLLYHFYLRIKFLIGIFYKHITLKNCSKYGQSP